MLPCIAADAPPNGSPCVGIVGFAIVILFGATGAGDGAAAAGDGVTGADADGFGCVPTLDAGFPAKRRCASAWSCWRTGFILLWYRYILKEVNMTDRQAWYKYEFLASTHFKEIRDKVYAKHPYCQICGKKFHLQPHHLSYERRGQKDEWKDIRMVCGDHHKECHYVLWLIFLPRKEIWLRSRYYFVKLRYKIWKLILSYRVGDPPRHEWQPNQRAYVRKRAW
jgi:hypothetical protein